MPDHDGRAAIDDVLNTLQSAATATGNGTALDVKGWSSVAIQVTGTFVGTLTFEATADGTNYVSVQAANLATGAVATTATGTGIYLASVMGTELFRARVSAYTSGSITAKARGAPYDTSQITVAGGGSGTVTANQGSAGSAWPVKGAGTAGTADTGVVTVQGIASGTVVPVSSATLATVAKQPALGTAGTASADVISVQGVASMTALKVDPSAVTSPVSLAANASYGTVACGELAGSATAAQNPNVACKEVTFKAEYNNAGRVYIGGSGVTKQDGTTDTTTGIELQAGEGITLAITNLNLTYRICDNAGDDLTYIALT